MRSQDPAQVETRSIADSTIGLEPPLHPVQAETKPIADSTVQLTLPMHVLETLEIDPAMSRAERLTIVLADQRSRWLAGSPVETERYLGEIPEIAADRTSRLAVVEGEIRARRTVGAASTLADFHERFPDLHDELTVLFEADGEPARCGALGAPGSDLTAPYPAVGPDEVDAERTVHDLIGRYEILRIIGRGGFGLVYLARDALLDRLVAIKVPRRDRVAREEDVNAFLREAQILAGLDHANIVPVYDVGRTRDGLCFVVSKWIDGEILTREALGEGIGPIQVALVIAAVADALAHAHHKGLVHRDVKPSNVLLEAASKPYLTDFGLALREEDFARGAAVAGTPAYMSPEQARGEWHRVDARTDIFSLGIVLFELLNGSHPYGTGVPSTIMRRIALEGPTAPLQLDPSIPRELERIRLRALAPRAADRYGRARELAEDLRLFAADAAARERSGSHRAAEGANGAPARDRADPTPGLAAAPVVPQGLRAFGPEDAEFFLDLLHGPRDREGLPISLRFWKTRIEAEESYPVGVIYGPSGCGKSSMVRAGLLPRLAPRIVAIYDGATRDLEPRLLARIRRACPGITAEATLIEALAQVRRGSALPRGSKLLIVLDQFEQWLHAHGNGPEDELVRALRQCDGERLQALIIVRADFWMAAGRIMRQLEVPIVEGENATAVDLFPPAHARKVLAAFGAAYGALSTPPAEPGEEQRTFIDRAEAMMTQDGTVAPVRLALFAEIVKNRAWTAETLGDLGGAVGIGVRFLDESFVEDAAPPEHRLHRVAASRVLAALLPGPGADIKGHLRSHRELLEASGYGGTPERFDSLMRILDSETRLLTPMAPAETIDADAPVSESAPTEDSIARDARHYQLTHDYLVPSIREWLDRQQRETRRGRAELILTERASLWGAKHERKQLPSPLEWASIRVLSDSKRWTETQRAMMRSADRNYLARAGRWALLIVAFGLGALALGRRIDEDRSRDQAAGLVHRVLDAASPQVPSIIGDLGGYRRWADPLLRDAIADRSTRPIARLHARLALLPADVGQADALVGEMLAADPEAFAITRRALSSRRSDLVPLLWQTAESAASAPDAAFRAAVALASYAPGDARWADRANLVVGQLVAQPSLLIPAWVELLRPVRRHLAPAVAARLREQADDNPLVASILADYAEDQPGLIADAVADTRPQEFLVLMGSRWKDTPSATQALTESLAALVERYRAQPRDPDAKRVANTAIALLRLGQGDAVWPLLADGPYPAIRSYLIDRMGTLRCDPVSLVRRLQVEGDTSIRAALMLSLSGFGGDQLDDGLRTPLIPELAAIYRNDPDPGLHAAAGLLLQRWGQADRSGAVDADLSNGGVAGGRRWYVNSQGQTMVVLRGQNEFRMGSPEDEPWRRSNENQQVVRVLPFDIGATEVTIGHFRAFVEAEQVVHREYDDPARTDPRLPRTSVDWYDAAAYCNWLSAREGLPPDQWSYVPNDDEKYAAGMRVAADFVTRTGYRLPTEAEWEYACRAGTVTSRPFGSSDELSGRSACYQLNSSDRPFPVGSLQPNAFGLFDMLGNVAEWCQDPDRSTERDTAGEVLGDTGLRRVRGGGFTTSSRHLRSATRYADRPVLRNESGGFRVARSRPDRDR